MTSKSYKYDIAISLCKEDAEYACSLKKQINPGLNVFFYENNQEEIISRSGTEVFASVFKEARVVVILSRKQWGQTFYTELEMHSITDRYKKEGLSFLVVIPMAPGEKPIWYPETMIYADPLNMSVEKIVTVIEYRVTQSGGIVKQVTLEDVHQNLLSRVEGKKKVIELQVTPEALDSVVEEFKIVQILAIEKRDYIKNTGFWDTDERIGGNPFEFFFMIDGFLLEIRMIKPDETYQRVVTTQDYTLSIQLFSVAGRFDFYQPSENKKLIAAQQYKYLYDQVLKGWAVMYVNDEQVSKKEESILFRYRDPEQLVVTYWYYDLKQPISSGDLLDAWFQELVKHASARITQYV